MFPSKEVAGSWCFRSQTPESYQLCIFKTLGYFTSSQSLTVGHTTEAQSNLTFKTLGCPSSTSQPKVTFHNSLIEFYSLKIKYLHTVPNLCWESCWPKPQANQREKGSFVTLPVLISVVLSIVQFCVHTCICLHYSCVHARAHCTLVYSTYITSRVYLLKSVPKRV